MNVAELSVKAIAWTHLDVEAVYEATGKAWRPDGNTGEDLAVFAGRACYQSWNRPNPATADTDGYLRHIIDVGHMSVLEHGTVTFYMTGVSRSFTHELVRHRHLSYSQLSQRYVPSRNVAAVEPDIIAGDPHLHRVFTEGFAALLAAYRELLHGLERKLQANPQFTCLACGRAVARVDPGVFECGQHGRLGRNQVQALEGTALKKAARQAARAILPNAAETKIVVTGNYTGWRHFINMRATEHADVEIREVAVACLRELQRIAPSVFGDYAIVQLPDGTEIATTEPAMG
jgi:thymidylate synthase (FAD)